MQWTSGIKCDKAADPGYLSMIKEEQAVKLLHALHTMLADGRPRIVMLTQTEEKGNAPCFGGYVQYPTTTIHTRLEARRVERMGRPGDMPIDKLGMDQVWWAEEREE